MKTIKTDNITFNAAAQQVTIGVFNLDIRNVYAIINQTAGVVIYATGTAGKGFTTVVGNTITLQYDTSSMSDTDSIQVIYEDAKTENNAVLIGNGTKKFRNGFINGFEPTLWDEAWTNQGTGFRFDGGDAVGAGYLGISMPPEMADSEYVLTTKEAFRMPVRFGFGLSISQRILGQEVQVSLVGCDTDGNVETNTAVAPLTISGTVTIATNVATINFDTPHGLKGGDRVVLVGNTEKRLNVGPVLVTVVTPLQITVPCTLANGTYTAGGQVVWADIFGYVQNAAGFIFETATVTNATTAIRRNGGKHFGVSTTVATTTASQSNTSPYTEAFRSACDNEIIQTFEHVKLVSRTASSTSGASGNAKYTETIPDEDKLYKIRIRVRNLPNFTKMVAEISNISKTGTTTATVTTSAPHGLVSGDFVQIYGVRDITNFPNLTASTAVASVIDATNFTIVIGSASTTSSAGGVVVLNNGSVLLPGALNFSVQSVEAASNVLTITLNATSSGLLPGEMVQLMGMSAVPEYEGVYIVRRLTGSTVEVQKYDGSAITNVTSTNTGGALIKRTDVRIHYVRAMEYTRHLVETSNNRGVSDGSESLPIVILGGSVGQTTGLNSTAWSAAGWGGFLVNDVTSAAITTTTTTSSITPGSVANIGTYAHEFNIIVTAVSGTNPTMDVGIEESMDNGTNWKRIYDFPRITATGAYTSPALRAHAGTRYRYVQTITGTTPSFTRAINRVQLSINPPLLRNFIDRSIVLTTLNSVTPTYDIEGIDMVQLTLVLGTATVAPTVKLQGSEDGTNWYDISDPVLGVASSTVTVASKDIMTRFCRGIVTSAGSTVVANYLNIRAIGR